MGADDQNVEVGIMGAGSGRPPDSRRASLATAAAGTAAVPGTKRAVVLDAPGPPCTLAIRELPVPVPSAGWVLIRVRAFGLNRLELYLRLGLSQGVTFPRVPGIEATGVVERCPGGEFRAGQQVAALMGGMLVAVPDRAVTGVLQAAGPLDGRIMIDAANSLGRGVFGPQQLSLRSLADAFPRARWVRAFNSLSVGVMADDNHREPPWAMFLSGDEEAKPVVAQLIRDAGFDPVDLGGIDDSRLQDPGSALWTYTLTHDEATALAARIRSGDTAAADPLTAPFEKFRDHAPNDPAFFLEHLSRPVFEAGLWEAVQGKWDGIREAFHGFDPAQVAAMTPAEIAATENDPRVIRNKAKIRATVQNAREVLAVLDSYGSIRAYLASFPDAHAASADMRRRFKFLGDAGVWRLLTSAARDIGG
jgi:3-methyladenine DNA glycosylase Tag/predicted dinucleotide-binding enzyme